MGRVVFADTNRIDSLSMIGDVRVVDSEEGIQDLNQVSLHDATKHQYFVPANLWDSLPREGDIQIFHELEQYPFFQKIKAAIITDGDSKGVFRMRRRIAATKNNCIIASDLCVLTSVFGEIERVRVKHSRMELEPQHVIIMIHYSKGTMAHVDYTFSDKDLIELEWSGINKIIEFHSDEMNPIEPKSYTYLPLSYRVDSILEHSVSMEALRPDFERWLEVLKG